MDHFHFDVNNESWISIHSIYSEAARRSSAFKPSYISLNEPSNKFQKRRIWGLKRYVQRSPAYVYIVFSVW